LQREQLQELVLEPGQEQEQELLREQAQVLEQA
jgi:hypothetical protein